MGLDDWPQGPKVGSQPLATLGGEMVPKWDILPKLFRTFFERKEGVLPRRGYSCRRCEIHQIWLYSVRKPWEHKGKEVE